MAGIAAVPFDKGHVEPIGVPLPPMLLKIYVACGDNWTILKDGEPIAAGGICINSGIGSAWGLVGEKAKTLPVSDRLAFHHTVKRVIGGIIERNQLRRVDVIANPEIPKNVRWVSKLGFHLEGPMCDFYAVGKPAQYFARTQTHCEVR